MNIAETVWIIMGILFIFIIFSYIIYRYAKIQKIKDLASGSIEISVKEFFNLRKLKCFNKKNIYMNNSSFSGVYILLNKTKNMYYVGQGKNIYNRVNNHFTGKGNGDVYADYKYGDTFTIKLIDLSNSGFNNLNDLERETILAYKAYSRGYNKTRGNR